MNKEIVIIGAGITGLAAAMELQDKAVVLEKGKKVGGTVKSFCFDGYWFDNVVHLLHFRNKNAENRIKTLMGDLFKPCPPVGWVETKEGTVRYPFQLNIGGLNIDAIKRCREDFYDSYHNTESNNSFTSYKDFLLRTFGKAMCELFFFPYNEKLWKYPLDKMTSSAQTWNINRPSIDEFDDGIENPDFTKESYNINAYYPQPPRDSMIRGMEILPQMMAGEVKDLILNCEVNSIIAKDHKLFTCDDSVNYERCLSTIPLPELMRLCNVSGTLLRDFNKLKWIKVISVGLMIKRERPKDTGHWHYYADPKIPFTKLIYMTEFDKYNAPENGFCILLEVPVLNITPMFANNINYTIMQALRDLKILKAKDQILGMYFWEVNPAYVIFTKETQKIIKHCKEYLEKFNITTLGRYGNWEYSSISENIEDGFNYARKIMQK